MRQIRKETGWFEGQWEQPDVRQDIRRQWEQLLNLSKFLSEKERAFLEAVAEQGGRISRLARLTRRSPAALRRQMHDIARRLLGWELRIMLDHPHAFSSFEIACLREHHIRKRSLARIAEDFGATVYEVRKSLAAARTKSERLRKPISPDRHKQPAKP